MPDLARYDLIIFDKDGTLIDFDFMWSEWIEALAARLRARMEAPAAEAVEARLFQVMGYDPERRRTLPDRPLAVAPMAQLREMTLGLALELGLAPAAAAAAVDQAWHVPDPVRRARPFADLPALFGGLRARGLRVAVATSDDRAPTLAALDGLGAAGLVDALACADDRLPAKPAPEIVWHLCRQLDAPPARTVMVGDSAADMQMGRAAGAGLVVGVLSGVSGADRLRPLADLLLASVADLIPT